LQASGIGHQSLIAEARSLMPDAFSFGAAHPFREPQYSVVSETYWATGAAPISMISQVA
jgi:hypothetical protein